MQVLIGSLALRPALLPFGNSRTRVTTTPLPLATGAYGQLPGRDFNPLVQRFTLDATNKNDGCFVESRPGLPTEAQQ